MALERQASRRGSKNAKVAPTHAAVTDPEHPALQGDGRARPTVNHRRTSSASQEAPTMAHAPVVSDDDEPTQSETAPKAPAIAVPVVAAPEEPVTSTPINYTRMKVGVGFMIAAALVALAPAVKAVVTSLAAPTEVAAEPAPAPAADDAKASSVSALKARAKAVKQHK